jgi:hypothetical protein
MIENIYIKHIGKQSINIICNHCQHPKNHHTFVLATMAPTPWIDTDQDIPPTYMYTGNSLPHTPQFGLPSLIFLLLCFAWLPLNAQQPNQEDPLASLYKLKKVKSITAYETGLTSSEQVKAYYREYNANGNLTFELVYGSMGEVVKKYQSFYTIDNRIVKEVWTQKDYTDSVTFKYNGNKLVEEAWYWGSEKSRTRVVHFFDTLDRKVCTVSKNNWGVYVDSFFYENVKVVLVKNYNENGLLNSITENSYDSKERPTTTTLKDEDGNVLQTTNKLYTEVGPKSSETMLFLAPKGNAATTVPSISASMTESYKYDTQKQLKEITFKSFTKNELLVDNKVVYTYGTNGLPLTQSTLNVLINSKVLLRFNYTFF